MFSAPTLVSLLLLTVSKTVVASPCVAFDADFNLLAFGLNGKDWNAGQQDSWTSGSASDITTSGRPPFDGTSTTCYLAQFFNAIYFMNADKSNPSDVHIYDAGAKAWSTQKTTTGNFDPSSFNAILDHDTNVFYALSHNELFFLDMGELKTANSSALAWQDIEKSPYPDSYQPVMALAQNHIHFLDVPDVPAGSADIFTASFFQSEGVQQEFAFIPDDGSMTYVINVENNSTKTLAGPTTKDPKAQYAASITALVQLDSTGAVSFIPYKQGDDSTNAKAAWANVAKIAAAAPPGSSSAVSGSASGTATGVHSSGTGVPSGTIQSGAASPTSSGSANKDNGAMSNAISVGGVASALMAVIAFLQ
ncbi:hypothetical protein BN946_scf184748.g23 [Trametes cinnabarina]|uniref:Uncharacterized protein n=1 Tax=Pycnoporus cinnabarinus TaxID=5643 RepID=A0A060S8E0_PYCCI|nr:hypothetical protein BN946_scf184748.g23 [Trametes cinnabarina]